MKVLCINPAVSVRAYRQMKALQKAGHTVDLLYIGFGDSVKAINDDFWDRKKKIFNSSGRLSHFSRTLFPGKYKNLIQEQLRKGKHDIVFVYSMPDTLAAAATRFSNVPVIYDIRDMTTAFQKEILIGNYVPPGMMKFGLFRSIGKSVFYNKLLKLEGEAVANSSARTYVSDYTYDLARTRHACPKKNNLVFYNYAMKKDIKKPLDKLSAGDGETHIVFEGVLSMDGYRKPLLEMFSNISKMKLHLHVYGMGAPDVLKKYKAAAKKSKHFHLHEPLPHDKLLRELTKYDWGLTPFVPPRTDRDHFDTMLPNKFFDYLAAGLPLIVPDSRSMVKFVKKEKAGVVFRELNELPSLLKKQTPGVDPEKYVIENHIHEITGLMKKLVKN